MSLQAGTSSLKVAEIDVNVRRGSADKSAGATPTKPHCSTRCKVATALFLVAVGAAVPTAVYFANRKQPSWERQPSRFAASAMDAGLLVPNVAPDGTLSQEVHIQADPGNASSGILHLNYTAKLHQGISFFSLDHEESVLDVGCFDSHLNLELSLDEAEARAVLQPGVVVTGSHNWGCTAAGLGLVAASMSNVSQAARAILHRIVSVADTPADGATISLVVESVGLHSVFEHVNVTYINTLPPQLTQTSQADGDNVTETPLPTETAPSSRRRMHIWSHWGHKAKHAAHKAASAVSSAVDSVSSAVHSVSGTFTAPSINKGLHQFKWTPPDWVAVGPVSAKGSYAYFTLGVKFNMHVHDWDLQTAEIAASVQPDFKANARLTLHKNTPHATFIKQMVDDHELGEVDFAIGPVPVHATCLIDLSLRADIGAGDYVHYDTWVRAQYPTSLVGVRYDRYDGGWSVVKDIEMTPSLSHQFPPTLTVSTWAYLNISFVPDIEVNIDFFGGPTVTPFPYFTIATGHSYGGYNLYANCDNDQLFASTGWGVNTNVSAALELDLPGVLSKLDEKLESIGPFTVHRGQYHQLWDHCINTGVAGDVLAAGR